MRKLRVLWVPPAQRVILCGKTYTEEELSTAGLNADKMLRHKEAELVSVSPAAPAKKKAK